MNGKAKIRILAGILLSLWCLLGGIPAFAKDLARQTPILKAVALGGAEGDLRFDPAKLTFKSGTLYKLTLSNPSQLKHYFTAKDFADAIWTRKIEVGGAEIKGKVSEVELKPGSSLEWFFVPLQTGSYSLICTIPGHAEAGMVGQVLITE